MSYPVSAVRGRSMVKPKNRLLNDLVAYWPLDEASGDALDAHGSYDLTDYGGVSAGAGNVYATARAFDGAAQRLERASATGLTMGATDWTMACWFYVTEFSGASPYENHMIGSGRSNLPSGGSNLGVNHSQQLFAFWFSLSGSIDVHFSTAALELNTWYLAGWRWDATARQGGLRINALNWQTVAEGETHTANANRPFTLGATPDPVYLWTGRLGPAAYWDRVLTENEWLALYNAGAGLAYESFTE